MLFQVWADEPHRATRDLDLLGRGPNTPELYSSVFREIAEEPVEEDGLIFVTDAIRTEHIRENHEYNGLRLQFEARLANARIAIQIDIGVGDAMTPGPIEIEYPTLLDLPPPLLLAYSRETVVAEKFQAMVMLGMVNSRMKDFFDLWILSRDYDFDGGTLAEAIQTTFRRRATDLPTETPTALSLEFANDPGKQTQWKAFLQKGRLSVGENTFEDVIARLGEFLMHPTEALQDQRRFEAVWIAGSRWTEKGT